VGQDKLEAHARRFLIPYIDIGMDVRVIEGEAPRMAGQVILSFPGKACMKCFGFLTDERLHAEASRYGDAGFRPQVVWPNGLLASAAVGIGMALATGWAEMRRVSPYLSYDGNAISLTQHRRLEYLDADTCPHYSIADAGKVRFKPL